MTASESADDESGQHAQRVSSVAEFHGGAFLAWGERMLGRLDALFGRLFPAEFNPLVRSGAMATTTLLIATVSGIVLLLWYRPSVSMAHESVLGMDASLFGAGLWRSLHRYSSDACMLFTLLHAVKSLFRRQLSGARWLPWVSGLFLLSVLGLVGWTGYWLVWDERGGQVAVGTARFLDALPIFGDPLARSFLTDASINSLLFFLVFFFHMLVPMSMAFGLWLHLTRLSRPKWITGRALSVWTFASLVLLSVMLPADTLAPAAMANTPASFPMDWWYLAPLVLTDRLSGGMIWLVVLFAGALLASLPWALVKRRVPRAVVDTSKCNSCEKCFLDCPYEAITMVARTDDRRFPTEAYVIEERCVACGICAGSCDTAGIDLPSMPAQVERRRIEALIDERLETGGAAPLVAFACENSAASGLRVDPDTGICDALPGYLVLPMPCAGWLQPLTLERVLKHGVKGALIISCGPEACVHREGATWTAERLSAQRAPMLRLDKVDEQAFELLEVPAHERKRMLSEARAFALRRGASGEVPEAVVAGRSWLRTAAGAVVGVALLLGATWVPSVFPYALLDTEQSSLVVSFKHPGAVSENCRDLTEEEKAALPSHMQQEQICERQRFAVRLRVHVDGELFHRSDHDARGLWGDRSSIALERLEIQPGEHLVRVEVGDTAAEGEWNLTTERTVTFGARGSVVVLYDRASGFSWTGSEG